MVLRFKVNDDLCSIFRIINELKNINEIDVQEKYLTSANTFNKYIEVDIDTDIFTFVCDSIKEADEYIKKIKNALSFSVSFESEILSSFEKGTRAKLYFRKGESVSE